MSEEDKRELSLLSTYPSYLAFYQGKGILTLSNQQEVPCTFEVGQLRTGGIFLFCSDLELIFTVSLFASNGPFIEHFEGTTSDGFHLSSRGDITVTGNLSTNLTCLMQALSVDMLKDVQPHQIQFGLTNLFIQDALSFHLDHEGVILDLYVKPVEQYNNVMERVHLLRTIDVTCEVIGSLTDSIDTEIFTQVVNNLCYLLSVAQGTKIQWIYQTFFDVKGAYISRIHHSKVTKVYGSNSIIQDYLLRTFVEKTYSSYVANRERYGLDTGIIDTYLDAKAENDYLQVRGVKLAVAMEAIKAVFCNLQEEPIDETILHGSAFKKLQSKLRKKMVSLIEEANIPCTEALSIELCEKIPELNRRAFKKLLDDIFQRLQLKLNDEEKKRFIHGRNSLVHEGRFSCEVTAQKKKVSPSHQEMTQEFFFLVSILDRVILKLLGYQGKFVDAEGFVDRNID